MDEKGIHIDDIEKTSEEITNEILSNFERSGHAQLDVKSMDKIQVTQLKKNIHEAVYNYLSSKRVIHL